MTSASFQKKVLSGMAFLAVAFVLTGCAVKSAPPASARARERAAPNSAVRSSVRSVRVTGLQISFVLGSGRTVVLPSGTYIHSDGYRIVVSSGQIVGLESIPPGYYVAARRGRGKKKGLKKKYSKINIKRIKVVKGKISFYDDDDGVVVLPSGTYTRSGGTKLIVVSGKVTSLVL